MTIWRHPALWPSEEKTNELKQLVIMLALERMAAHCFQEAIIEYLHNGYLTIEGQDETTKKEPQAKAVGNS